MKKLISILTSVLLILGLTACNSTDGKNTGSTSGESKVDFPTKDITLICPFAPGGGTDALTRKVAEIAKAKFDMDMIVVNKTGGSGAVGMGEGSSAKADGHTVTMTTVESVLLPLAGLATFETDDFTPITRVNVDPATIIVRADSDYNSLEDVVSVAKESPDKISVMVSAYPTNYWLCGAMLEKEADIELNLVPAPGGAAEQIQNLMGEHVDAIIITAGEAASYVESGDFKLLAIAGDERNPMFPEVPLLEEEGYNIKVGTWRGLMVPEGTPPEIVEELDRVFTEVTKSDEMKEFLEKMGFGEGYLSAEDFQVLIDEQIVEYEPIISEYSELGGSVK